MTTKRDRLQPTAPRTTETELNRLISRGKRGDVVALERLYQLYARKIVNYIFRMTGSREEAEDLTQDTFVLAFKKLPTLKDNRKFQSWLFRIAQNNVYQRFRGARPHFESIDEKEDLELADTQRLANSRRDPEKDVLSNELQQMVWKVIAELPAKYREVFVLSALHRLSYQEISEIVGRSLASVKSDIHRARVSVRDKIKRYLGDNYGMSNLF